MNKKIIILLVLIVIIILGFIVFGSQRTVAPQSSGTAALPTNEMPPVLGTTQGNTPSLPPSGSVTPPPSAGNSQPVAASVNIQNFSFSPATLTVAVGTKVTWLNEDAAAHTVTSDNGSFGSSPLNQGDSYGFTFAKAGTYNYHCSIHPSMEGTVIVQ